MFYRHDPLYNASVRAVTRIACGAAFRREVRSGQMKRLTASVIVVVSLAATACGSGQRVTFSTYAKLGSLSVPAPSGFHRRTWTLGGMREGIVFSDGAIGRGTFRAPLDAGYLPERRNRVAFNVYTLGEPPPPRAPHLRLPLTFAHLPPSIKKANGVLHGGAIEVGSEVYGVQAWLGQDASAADRSTLLDALRAIRLN